MSNNMMTIPNYKTGKNPQPYIFKRISQSLTWKRPQHPYISGILKGKKILCTYNDDYYFKGRNHKKITNGLLVKMQAMVGMLCLLNRKKYNKFKNKKQPELPENQTIWKSNNQGVKKKHSSGWQEGKRQAAMGGRACGMATAQVGQAAAGSLGGPTFAYE